VKSCTLLKANIDVQCTYTLVDSASEEFTYLKTNIRNYKKNSTLASRPRTLSEKNCRFKSDPARMDEQKKQPH